MDSFQTVIYRKEDGLAHITLNRPQVLNAVNMQMRDDLCQVLSAVAEDPEVGSVVFRGAGRAFCAGADLMEFGTAPSLAVARAVRWERDVWGSLLDLKIPLICAIHGYCFGAGLEIALLCDIRIAAEDAVLGLPEVGLGLIPGAGGTQTLPRTVGIPAALELVLRRRRLAAEEALRLGLVTGVAPRAQLDNESDAMARRFLSLDRRAVWGAKEAISRGMELPLDAGLDLETRLALAAMGS